MRCPKCHYISFDSSERCRNCGYEFSLAVDAAALDLPIQTGDEPLGPMGDFTLANLDEEAEPAAAAPPPAGEAARGAAHRAVPAPELPLFNRGLDDDAPLVTPPAVPRPPLAVRRSTPSIARAPRQSGADTPLNLELPDLDRDAAGEREAPPAALAADATSLHPVASLTRRIAAGLIDLAILGGIDAVVVYFTLRIVGFSLAEILLLPAIPLVAFLALLNGGYFVGFVAAGGQTIGKMAAGIKVVPDGSEPGWHDRVALGTAFLRAAAYLVSLVPAGLGLLPALFAADHRAVHDRLAHTRVVKA